MLSHLKGLALCTLMISSVSYAQLAKITVSNPFPEGKRDAPQEIIAKVEKRLASQFNIENVQILNETNTKVIEGELTKQTIVREISFRQPGASSQDYGVAGVKYVFTSCKTGLTSCLDNVTVELTQSLAIKKSVVNLGEKTLKGDMIRTLSTISFSGATITTEFETLKIGFYDWLLGKNQSLKLEQFQGSMKSRIEGLNKNLAADLK